MGPQSEPINQLEFRDFHEVYPISKTLLHSHEFQNVGRFILGLPYKQKIFSFHQGGWNFHRSKSQTKFKRIFVRDQGFNKNTSYSYNPRNYKRPPLVIWIRIFEFCFFLISYNQFNSFSLKNQFSVGKIGVGTMAFLIQRSCRIIWVLPPIPEFLL